MRISSYNEELTRSSFFYASCVVIISEASVQNFAHAHVQVVQKINSQYAQLAHYAKIELHICEDMHTVQNKPLLFNFVFITIPTG